MADFLTVQTPTPVLLDRRERTIQRCFQIHKLAIEPELIGGANLYLCVSQEFTNCGGVGAHPMSPTICTQHDRASPLDPDHRTRAQRSFQIRPDQVFGIKVQSCMLQGRTYSGSVGTNLERHAIDLYDQGQTGTNQAKTQ
jgi:hypothetical protein